MLLKLFLLAVLFIYPLVVCRAPTKDDIKAQKAVDCLKRIRKEPKMEFDDDLESVEEKKLAVRQFCLEITDKLDEIGDCISKHTFVTSNSLAAYLFSDESRRTQNIAVQMCTDWENGWHDQILQIDCLKHNKDHIAHIFKTHGYNVIRKNVSLRCSHLFQLERELTEVYLTCKVSSKMATDRVKNTDRLFVILGFIPCFANQD